MNPLTNIKNVIKLNDRELEMGLAGTKNSWHMQYRDSAWIFLGGLPYELTEGDLLSVFSQYGEIVHINLIRDHQTGNSKGFGFICFMDQRSTILTVDNLNGIKLCGRTIRVDHVQTYKLPKDLEKLDADKKKLFLEGCAPQPLPQSEASSSQEEDEPQEKRRTKKKSQKEKKSRKKKKKKKKKVRDSSSESSSSDSDGSETPPKRPERDSGRDGLSRSPRQNKLRSGDEERRRSRDRNDDRRRRSRSRDRSRDRVREHSRNQERRRYDPDSSSSKRRNDYRR